MRSQLEELYFIYALSLNTSFSMRGERPSERNTDEIYFDHQTDSLCPSLFIILYSFFSQTDFIIKERAGVPKEICSVCTISALRHQ